MKICRAIGGTLCIYKTIRLEITAMLLLRLERGKKTMKM